MQKGREQGREGNTGEERGSNEQKKGRVQKKDEREGGRGAREKGKEEEKKQGEEGALHTTHLGPSNSIDEGPILLHLLRGYDLCLSRGGLIVVKETDEALVCWPLQCLFTDPGEKRIFRLVLTP